MSINHKKYTLVIVDEFSRYTWVQFLRKKSQAPEIIMSFIRMVENQNDVKLKQIRTNNGTEFRNHELESFCDEKGISQKFSSHYTLEQISVAERKNKTLIEVAKTMLNGSILSKHFWTKAVRIACYTQNRSIIIKRLDKTPYEIFWERIPDISYFHVFGCPVFIHNNKENLGEFDAKADDGYFLGYSFVSKAFRVFNTRRQQVEETYHVTFDESMEATRFTNTLIDELRIDDSSRYPPDRWSRDQNSKFVNIIGDPGKGMLTRSMAAKLIAASACECLFVDFLSKIEPKKVSKALKYPGWIDAMQKELNQLYRNKVRTLVPLPHGKAAIGSKWVFRNKKDEHGITIKNKARLVAQEEVYVKEPLGIESYEFPDYVCKLYKVLYGLKQAPNTWGDKVKVSLVRVMLLVLGGNNSSGHARVVKCYNCQGEGHMARQCSQPKRPRNAAWYNEKAMLAEAQKAGQSLDEEQLTFLAYPGVPDG
nr:retrovirus-related Pol polyprotein from transposon TNT 1-94 [Tanacetum cinerariifolium]